MMSRSKIIKTAAATAIIVLSFAAGSMLTTGRTEKTIADLNPEERYEKITNDRDQAIRLAKDNGDYRCCIEPPCSMCYMQANEWNNQTPGTCACDDLIAQGKEPCPECRRGMCSSENSESATCEVDLP